MTNKSLNDYKFEDVKPYWIIKFEDGFESLSSGEEYSVDSVSGSYITVVVEDEEYGGSEEINISKNEWVEEKGEVVSVPSESQIKSIKELDSLVESMESMSKKANKIAKDAGLGFESVVLTEKQDLIEWHTSRC